jgi:hypothetical protein
VLTRYQRTVAQEACDDYIAHYDALKREGDVLAHEVAEIYPDATNRLVDLFTRLRSFKERSSALHVTDPGGLPHVDDPELAARGLQGFSRDQPSLLEGVHLRDWQTGREVWPPYVAFGAIMVEQSMPMFAPRDPDECTSNWWRARERRAAEQSKANEQQARYFVQQTQEQEERMNREERERFAHRCG